MKKKLLVFGMIVTLFMSLVILTACENTESIPSITPSAETEKNEESNAPEETMKDYTFEKLSYKLPSSYGEEDNDSESTMIYSSETTENVMTLFSVATLPAEGVDFIATASESLGDYDFELTGYDLVSKAEPKVEELNGIKTISVDVKYKNDSVNGEAEIEYCYAQEGDTVYVICFEIFTHSGKKIESSDFSYYFDSIKSSLIFAE